ncbi:cobalamin biosynthesis protein [Streptomyces armeniacus]|uniref:Cobalamin biosynthesis protein CobD n=1 Tax=Streptomyces armeniacus TaxID=83291 RepID=A0A345XRD3_9ACTN|nr:cobalamin biosynthesis protein [Streptomyces armeniacus]AXK34199.1 cobalamin biosynthesis protein [Streptomyces armeniacus]
MRTARAHTYGAVLGYLTDLLLADPRRGHPVAAFGRAAGRVERALWRDHRGAGALHTALCVGGVTAAAAAATALVRGGVRAGVRADGRPDAHPPHACGGWADATDAPAQSSPHAPHSAPHAVLTAAVTWAVLGGTSLAREAAAVGAALEAGDLDEARRRLPRLCGRDPYALDADGLARAVVESVAENTSDAVVGALVWGAVAGVPGMAAFRAANTLDAMVGHKSPAYRRFGWAAARLDDVLGWPGSRLTAALATLAGPDPRGAALAWRTDARAHPSPNAGPVEAAFAGALGVRLGGTLSYGGRIEHRPVLNAPGRTPVPGDIARAVRLSRRVSACALAVTLAARTTPAAGGAASAGGPHRKTGPHQRRGHR